MSSEKERKKLSTKLNHQFLGIYELKDESGHGISDTFQRLPLRKLVDYYKIIKTPISLHGIGRNLKKFHYTNAQEFVTDLVQMAWNAKLYNVRGSVVYDHALILDAFIKEMVVKLNGDKWMGVLYYPDLGPLPEGDSEIDPTGGSSTGASQSAAAAAAQQQAAAQQFPYNPYDGASTSNAAVSTPSYPSIPAHGGAGVSSVASHLIAPAASGIRRGRPPIIDKPYETRIKLILKQFKKLRLPDDPSYNLTTNFDRLPDPKYNSPFYSVIKTPISLFEIRTKVRTRKYHTVDEFIADITLMFDNTKYFYSNAAPGSQGHNIYQEALIFEQEANKIIRQELLKPEKELLTANTPGGDGIIRIPLDSIEIEGYTYHIGDWVLIKNDNDPQRPTVGQIFRLWATEDGTKYTNVCWYYRPEQTCHRVDRLFFTNEVCKTGQYRDHIASEIVGPCYVIFLTRYQKGDLPEGVIPNGCPWFICEFRYNETTHVFNRIRTWKACLPDEIRDKQEQPLIPLNEPRKLIKFESPIKNMLPQGVDSKMAILDAQQGANPNTPPVVGSVYIRGGSDDDELGQYTNSPNVVRLSENDNAMRQAYIFTPPLQLKLSGSSFPSNSHNNNNHHHHANNNNHTNSINTVNNNISGSGVVPTSQYNGVGINLSYLQPNSTFGAPISNGASVFPPDDKRLLPTNQLIGGSTGAGIGGVAGIGGLKGNFSKAPPSSYAASVNIYRQHLQQQQQQHQQYQQSRYNNRLDSLPNNSLNNKRAVTPTGNGVSVPPSNTYSSAITSKYSTPLIGGILSYTTVDEDNVLSRITEGINHKKRKIEVKKKDTLNVSFGAVDDESDAYNDSDDDDSGAGEDEDEEDEEEELVEPTTVASNGSTKGDFVTEIVWYRTPPTVIPNKILTSNGLELGHSAKYLAWKANQEATKG